MSEKIPSVATVILSPAGDNFTKITDNCAKKAMLLNVKKHQNATASDKIYNIFSSIQKLFPTPPSSAHNRCKMPTLL